MMDPDDERVRNCLNEFAEELWMKRRLGLQEVIDCLEKLDHHDSDANSIRWWTRFIRLLEAECSGRQFSNDKQWSELMNLMQISKKLNHRSVKFKDIIRNKQLIESNELSIRKLNESVRLCQTIGSSLDQLELVLNGECCLKLRQDLPHQLDELITCKSFLENRCRSNVRKLQLELDTEVNASCVSQIQVCRERVDRYTDIINGLLGLLNNLQALYYHLLQLGPLINVDRNFSDLTDSNGLDQLDNSVGACKRTFAQVQEFSCKLVGFLKEVASHHRAKKAPYDDNDDSSSSLILMKLVNSKGQLTRPDLLVSGLERSLARLDECRRTLDSVIHQLRLEFGRFYFVSDLELLTIIALDSRLVVDQTAGNQQAKRLLGKLFNNSIESFIVTSDQSQRQHLLGIRSPYNETILFPEAEVGWVPIKKSVNLYSVEIVRILNETLRKLRKTLQFELNRSLDTRGHNSDMIDWTLPVQLMIVAENIKFCQNVEDALRRNKTTSAEDPSSPIEIVLRFYGDRFKQLSGLKRDEVKHLVPGDDKLGKFKLSAAISTTVHFISILGGLMDDERPTLDVEDWKWVKLARYYRNSEGRIEVRIADTCFEYKFDFLAPQANDLSCGPQAGGFKRLINTKITEQCLLAASQSIGNFRLGSSPFGPAGSGKTETIKSLGLLLGCQVIVHNCDESNDGRSLDQLVWGLAHTGLWGCFDEFNRLSSSALSSISSSLELVQASIRESKRMVELPDGRMMPVDGATAFFVTMNPADPTRGYRGRRKLPANLKQLFLPVAMMRVQIDSIVSESLLALGAELEGQQCCLEPQEARQLGCRLANFMETLARDLIQKSSTCVWDLRLVLAILKRLKPLVGSELQSKLLADNRIHLQSLLIRSIVEEIEPRLAHCDQSVFQHLLKINFPPDNEDNQLDHDTTITNEDPEETFLKKLKQASVELFPDHKMAGEVERLALKLKHQIDSRAGVILLGPARSGKSTSWRLLQSVLADSVDWIPANPRASQRENLFGLVDRATGKWIDGPLTLRVRQALQILLNSSSVPQAKTPDQVWLILDGPIDPDWIESFNSVLDDNQVLTLSSGERLNFSPALGKSIKLIIECDSLEFASPASVSRLGLVLHEPLLRQQSSPKMHLNPMNEATQANLEMARDFMGANRKGRSVSLVVVSGNHQGQRCEFISHLFKSTKFTEYNCSPLSNCNHLLELVAPTSINSRSQEEHWFVINNVHLIGAEDQWQVKSFMELLRFMVTYGGFYNDDDMTKQSVAGAATLRKINATFVITVDSLDHLDPRTLAQGCSIHMAAGLDSSSPSFRDHFMAAEVDEAVEAGQILLNKHPQSAIVTLSNDSRSRRFADKSRSSIMDKFGAQQNFNILTFRNSKEAKRSVDHLEELLDKFCGGGGGGGSSLRGVRELFLLNDLECKLMNPRLKSHLFHQLNRLKGLSKVAKFVFLAHNLDQPTQIDTATFWLSLGPVILMEENKDYSGRNDFILKELMSNDEAKWFQVKIKSFFRRLDGHGTPVDAPVYLSTVVNLIKRYRLELDGHRRTLADGLGRLEEFEGEIERVKSQCQREEFKLDKTNRDITLLVRSIDGALEGAKGQRNELNELKQQQVAKRHELELQKGQLNRELSEVSKLVEESKLDVSQYLKPEALNEIKALRSPPTTIKDILDVLFTLLRLDDDLSWPSIRSHLTKYSLKDELTSYNFQKTLDESLLNKVTRLMDAKKVSFTAQSAARASKAVVPILGWIRATIEYGRVLVRLKPLKGQLELHEIEAKGLSEAARELELKLAEVDARIQEDSERLAKLQLDYEDTQRVASSIKVQLAGAQLARHNLEGQIGRWRHRLSLIKVTLDGRLELIGLCSLVVGMILFYEFQDQSNHGQLEDWMELFGMAASSRVELANKMLDLTNTLVVVVVGGDGSNVLALSSSDPIEHVNRVLQLLCIRLHQELGDGGGSRDNSNNNDTGGGGGNADGLNLPLPPILLDIGLTKEASLGQEEIVRYLAFKFLLCQSKSNLAIINCNNQMNSNTNDDHDYDDWIQSIEMASRFDKLALVELSDDNDDLDLDIMDHVLTKLNLCGLSPASINNNYISNRLLLLGRLDKHTAISHLVRPIRLLTGFSSLDEIQSSIMELLLNLNEPKLSSQTGDLELEFKRKQHDCHQGELRLLNRLATMNFRTTPAISSDNDQNKTVTGYGNGGLHEDLVSVLGELNKLNGLLDGVSGRLQAKQAELRGKQENYREFVREISQFYLDHLADLGHMSKFYNFPLEAYLQSLIDNNVPLTNDTINYRQIIKRAKQSMRPEDRLQFELSLLSQQQTRLQIDLDNNGGDSVRSVLNELLLNISSTINRKGSDRKQQSLMVVLHDQTKSSPQLEVDEFFRLRGGGGGDQLMDDFSHTYTKFYATGGSLSSLETRLEATLNGLALKSQDNQMNRSNSKVVHCVCIANAHLAAKWLNGHLIKLLQSTKTTDNQHTLVLLIGESSGGSDVEQFDSRLLDFARVKYWHDDSMLELTGRFNLLVSSMLSNCQVVNTYLRLRTTVGSVRGKSIWASELLDLAEQTVLFHVVCQEKARKNYGHQDQDDQQDKLKSSWKCQNYSFDYDQLCLALKTLGRLQLLEKPNESAAAAAAGGCVGRDDLLLKSFNNLRERYCHYLADFVYGSRMETLEDEQSLVELIKRFLGSKESATMQMNKFRELQVIRKLEVGGGGGGGGGDSGNKKIDYGQQLNNLVAGGC